MALNSPLDGGIGDRRLIVAFGAERSEDITALRSRLDDVRCELAERDLDAWLVDGDTLKPLLPARLALEASDVASLTARRSSPEADFELILIGKDGGRKETSTDPDSVRLFLDAIDGMPMRRAEMAQKDGSC